MCLGIATGFIEPNKKGERVSLLKPYTNFDKIKAMSVEELAKFLEEFDNDICDYCSLYRDFYPHCVSIETNADCVRAYIRWLETEVKE